MRQSVLFLMITVMGHCALVSAEETATGTSTASQTVTASSTAVTAEKDTGTGTETSAPKAPVAPKAQVIKPKITVLNNREDQGPRIYSAQDADWARPAVIRQPAVKPAVPAVQPAALPQTPKPELGVKKAKSKSRTSGRKVLAS